MKRLLVRLLLVVFLFLSAFSLIDFSHVKKGPLMKSMLFRRIAPAICLTCLCIISFASIGPVKSVAAYSVQPCNGLSCDGLLPQAHGCTAGAYSVNYNEYDNVKMYLMYSRTCNAMFVQLASPIVQYLAQNIHRTNPPASYSSNNGNGQVNGATTKNLVGQMVGYTGTQIFAYISVGDKGLGKALIYNP